MPSSLVQGFPFLSNPIPVHTVTPPRPSTYCSRLKEYSVPIYASATSQVYGTAEDFILFASSATRAIIISKPLCMESPPGAA